MNYLATVVQSKFPDLLQFYSELSHVEAASKGVTIIALITLFIIMQLTWELRHLKLHLPKKNSQHWQNPQNPSQRPEMTTSSKP
jgi:hypothetical protein